MRVYIYISIVRLNSLYRQIFIDGTNKCDFFLMNLGLHSFLILVNNIGKYSLQGTFSFLCKNKSLVINFISDLSLSLRFVL